MRPNQKIEQMAYQEIREALTESFLVEPQRFMEHFRARPEDLTGQQLREYYPHFLAQGLEIKSSDPFFRRRFYAGGLF